MGNDPEKKDGFETFRKMENDLEKSVQSWNRPENWQSSG